VVSGVLLGSFVAIRPNIDPVLRRYREQGIRLLLVAHPLIALALYLPLHRPGDGPLRFFFLRHYMTDLLAVLFLGLVPLVPRMSARTRLAVGLGAMVCQRALEGSTLWNEGPWLLLREVLNGVDFHSDRRILIENYPLLNIAGMFLVGTFIGDFIGRRQKAGEIGRASRTLLRAALVLPLASGALLGVWMALKTGYLPDAGGMFRRAFYPDREGTLFPLYLAFVLALLGIALQRDATGKALTLSERAVETVGKTSLFTYVLQYYLVQAIPCLLGLQREMTVRMWAVWTSGAILVLFGAATLWNRYVKKV
jgi:hypothetical protein